MAVVIEVISNRAPELQGRARQSGGRIVAQTARRIEALAKQRVAVRDGATKGSIMARQVAPFTWEITASAAASFLEWGTGKRGAQANIKRPDGIKYDSNWPGMDPQQFLTPACDQQRPVFEALLAELIEA